MSSLSYWPLLANCVQRNLNSYTEVCATVGENPSSDLYTQILALSFFFFVGLTASFMP